MTLHGFPRCRRILKSWHFRLLQSEGERLVTRRMVFLVRPNDVGYSRLGQIVSRKVGNAVVRNRVRRVVREVFRLHDDLALRPLDIVVIPRPALNKPASFHDVAEEFSRFLDRYDRLHSEKEEAQ